MPFKIIQTCEEGNLCLSIVPSAWERDGVLWWPKTTGVAKLLRDENSHPTSKWQTMQCIKKRVCRSRAEAESELNKMEALSDTETEMTITVPAAKKIPKNIASNLNITKREPINFNEFVTLPGRIESVEDIVENTVATELQLTDEHIQNVVFIPQLDQLSGGDTLLVESIQDNHLKSLSVETVATNQAHIMENLTKIISCLAHIKTSMDYLNERVSQIDMFTREKATEVQPEDLLLSIDSLNILDELEQNLKDQAVVAKYITTLSHICGISGRENGIDCCYRLIDNFITRQFLTTCTWTGISRDNNEAEMLNGESDRQLKVPFVMYKNIRCLFLKLILQADNSFTAIKCDEFFKRVLKNSKQRLLSKTVSKHKNRPRNLKYKVRHEEK
ncbi:uncharacterized protein LOC129719627 [Wyeomyia smithii]|uniref:uncharacterized protein LOC129719627 n=1 Tax=Wyeomyia smithii TaxID=174621 RepID=UPI002467E0B6|nr:uncharacterized protein LOC129719627 [Wyeomyia smithii]